MCGLCICECLWGLYGSASPGFGMGLCCPDVAGICLCPHLGRGELYRPTCYPYGWHGDFDIIGCDWYLAMYVVGGTLVSSRMSVLRCLYICLCVAVWCSACLPIFLVGCIFVCLCVCMIGVYLFLPVSACCLDCRMFASLFTCMCVSRLV